MLMYLCYMDESGDPGPRSDTPAYTVSAILVEDRAWSGVFEDLVRFRRYLNREFGLRMRDEVKATQLVNGSGPWAENPIAPDTRMRIFRAFMRLQPKTGATRAFAVVVSKARLETVDEIRETAWRYAFNRLEVFTRKNSTTVMILHDVGDGPAKRRLARRMRRFEYVGQHFGYGSEPRPFAALIEDPVERQSHESYFIQLADLNSYAAYRHDFPSRLYGPDLWEQIGDGILRDADRLKRGVGIVQGP